MSTYMIGRLARKTRVKADSIRFYERQGLVCAEGKTPAGYRLYGEAAVRRLTVIKHAQRCGFTLAEIGRLLYPRQGTEALRVATRRMLREKKTEVDKTLGALQAMSEALGSLLVAMESSADEPASAEALLIEKLQTERSASAKAVESSIGGAAKAEIFRHALR